MHLASSDSYENSIIMPIGKRTGTPEEVLDCACGLYLDDPAAST